MGGTVLGVCVGGDAVASLREIGGLFGGECAAAAPLASPAYPQRRE
jgi:hypothetical protein